MDEALAQIPNDRELDYLVNNAGINILEPLLEVTKEGWEKVMAVNAYAPLVCTQKAVKKMLCGTCYEEKSIVGTIFSMIIGKRNENVPTVLEFFCSLEVLGNGVTQTVSVVSPFGTMRPLRLSRVRPRIRACLSQHRSIFTPQIFHPRPSQ